MKYGIIVNPAAGKLKVDDKMLVLANVKRVFGLNDCEIAGGDVFKLRCYSRRISDEILNSINAYHTANLLQLRDGFLQFFFVAAYLDNQL